MRENFILCPIFILFACDIVSVVTGGRHCIGAGTFQTLFPDSSRVRQTDSPEGTPLSPRAETRQPRSEKPPTGLTSS